MTRACTLDLFARKDWSYFLLCMRKVCKSCDCWSFKFIFDR